MHFKFSPDILSRLGEELIPNPDQGIMELVKNSYDADATECTVELINTEATGGSLVVSDNGVGMNLDVISDGWLVIGRSKKATRLPTQLGRLPVGDKGLGRLAALRQGSHVTLKTRPTSKPGVEYSLSINWQDFDQATVVEDVTLTSEKHETQQPQGTDTIIQNVRFKLGKREVQRLARELLLLADPFDSEIGFRPKLIAPGFSELEKRVQEAYFEDAEYRLSVSLDANGKAEARLMDWKGDILFHANHRDLTKREIPYKTVAATLEVWIFGLSSQTFSRRDRTATVGEIRDWLSIVGGVHLYHRGLRVKPYGDSGNDWLNINLERAKAAEDRPSTNTVLGRVIVTDPDDILIQKTDRLGFIESEAFSELREFAIDAFNWMADVRFKESRKKREQVKRDINQVVSEAKAKVEETIETLEIPEISRTQVLKVIENYEKIKERETQLLREDVLLYRSLATAGTTAAVFAHESGKPVTVVEKAAKRIATQGQKLLAGEYAKTLAQPVEMLYRAANSLRSFAKFPLHLLKRAKRKSSTVDVHSVIAEVSDLFQPFLEEAKVDVKRVLADSTPSVRGSIALVEAILVNLMTNAINAFNDKNAFCEQRQIMICTELTTTHLKLRFLDNGSGIKGIELDEIWLPGRTTTTGGTGLGLTIVKDSVADLGGQIWAIPNGELGGAEFMINLPLIESL
ncbi:MAG: histidine kinase [Acaryochloris sp. RU_4_1]|nr:histidine kinase [Acaryochloris sp. RU_4_1]NJR56011.1 histidine kinase [Acaryochloris sp. CRU_2_0]